MKKTAIAIVAILLFPALIISSLTAQELTQKGIKVGWNIADCYGNDTGDSKVNFGLSAGVFAEFSLDDRFSVIPELFYTQKGFQTEGIDQSNNAIILTTNLNYLELTILGNFKLPTSGEVGINLFAGPALDFNLNSNIKQEVDGSEIETDLDNVSAFDVGVVIGANMNIGFSSRKIIIEPRYTFGLISTDNSASNLDLFNNVFTVNFGFGF